MCDNRSSAYFQTYNLKKMINLKMSLKVILFLILASFLVLSCSDDFANDRSPQNNQQNALHLMSSGRTAGPDGGNWANSESDSTDYDDDFDYDEFFDDCFEFVFPIDVTLTDGSTQTIASQEELDVFIKTWFDQNPESEDFPSLNYPITIVVDSTTATVQSEEELCEIIEQCFDDFDFDGEWGDDFDEILEDCFEVIYPIDVTLPDGTTQTVNSDDELEQLIETWYEQNPESEECPTPNFPIDIITSDMDTVAINSEMELDNVIEECFGDEGYGDGHGGGGDDDEDKDDDGGN